MPRPLDQRVIFFGRSDFRDNRSVFGIRQTDRFAHMYVVGKTGTGKSTLLETLARQDIAVGNGFALLDPHGDLYLRLLRYMRPEDEKRLIVWDVPDTSRPLFFNPLESVPADKQPLAASAMLEVVKKLWPSYWGPRMEHLLRYAFFALLEHPGATLGDVLRLLIDDRFRKEVGKNLKNEEVRIFWLSDYEEYPKRFRAEAVSPIQSKVGAFLAHPTLAQIFSSPKSSFDLRRVMDDGKILLVNLSKGELGEDAAALLGALLVAKIGITALARADSPEDERPDFLLYLDEFQSFTTLSLASMLSELRKYRLGMVLAHQYLAQLEPEIRDAVLGNVGTMLSFRLGADDARTLEKEFLPEFGFLDLMRLPNYHFYLKLMYQGAPTKPFSGETLRPFD